MKDHPIKSITFAACLASASLLSNAQAATIINVDLGNSTALAASEVAGVVPSANWKQASGNPDFSGVTLNFSDGTSSGATISGDFSQNITTRVAVTSDLNTTMFTRAGGINSALGSNITVSSLPTTGDWSSGYNVYIYFAPNSTDNNTRTLNLTLGGTTYYAQLATGSSNYTGTFSLVDSTNIAQRESGNYAVFSGVTGSSFTLNLLTDVQGTIGAAGMQIVAVPEPSALLLVTLGAGILIARRKRQ